MKKLIALTLTLGLTALLGACETGTQQTDPGAPTDGTAPGTAPGTDPGTAPPAGEPTDPAAPPAQP